MSMDFRYRRLGYVTLNVTDLGRSAAFYESLVGLQPAGEGPRGERLFRCSPRHHDVVLQTAPRAGLRRIGWEMESHEDLGKLQSRLVELGLPVRPVPADECAALGLEQAFRTTEPHTGATFEYYASMSAAAPFAPTVTKIARLGHVVLATADHAACERLFLDQLNYRASDRVEGAVTFMRCFPNPLHHSFGLANARSNRLHHVNFMVTDIDDIGIALHRFRKHGVPIVYGPGRHPPSDSIFLYFLDPDQLTLEYSFGMEEFPERTPRPPRMLPMSLDSLDYWGAEPDPMFAANGAIESVAG